MKPAKTARNGTSDEEIVALYWARDEQAIALTQQKYGAYLLQVARHFLESREDCEECQSSTYLALWNAIPPTRPKNLLAFATQILRRLAVNQWRSSQRKRDVPKEITVCIEELQTDLGGGESPKEQFSAGEIARAISAFLRKQPPKKRYLFIARYYLAQSVEELAKNLGCSNATVYRKLEQIRTELKTELEQEGLL